jgi:hypothetical protein
MAEIQIIIPQKGAPLVQSYERAVIPNECIYWHVRCFNPAVKSVKIQFERREATFFAKGAQAATTCERQLDYHVYDRDSKAKIGETVLWAKAPQYKSRVDDKYTVIGLGVSGRKVSVVDPKIITDGP